MPVGVPVVGDETVAVSVTSCPKTGELGEKERAVVDVGVEASVTVTAGEVPPLKLLSSQVLCRDRVGAGGKGCSWKKWQHRLRALPCRARLCR